MQFLRIVSALHAAACQLSPLLAVAEAALEPSEGAQAQGEGAGAGSETQGRDPVQSSLVRRLLAEVASPSVLDLTASMLSVVDRQAASSGDKANLIVCSQGRFPEVSPSLSAFPLSPSLPQAIREGGGGGGGGACNDTPGGAPAVCGPGLTRRQSTSRQRRITWDCYLYRPGDEVTGMGNLVYKWAAPVLPLPWCAQVAACRASIKEAEEELERLLPKLRKAVRNPTLEYFSVSGTSYLIEVRTARCRFCSCHSRAPLLLGSMGQRIPCSLSRHPCSPASLSQNSAPR